MMLAATKAPKVNTAYPNTPPAWKFGEREDWIHVFMFISAKFWPCHLNVAAEINTNQTRLFGLFYHIKHLEFKKYNATKCGRAMFCNYPNVCLMPSFLCLVYFYCSKNLGCLNLGGDKEVLRTFLMWSCSASTHKPIVSLWGVSQQGLLSPLSPSKSVNLW